MTSPPTRKLADRGYPRFPDPRTERSGAVFPCAVAHSRLLGPTRPPSVSAESPQRPSGEREKCYDTSGLVWRWARKPLPCRDNRPPRPSYDGPGRTRAEQGRVHRGAGGSAADGQEAGRDDPGYRARLDLRARFEGREGRPDRLRHLREARSGRAGGPQPRDRGVGAREEDVGAGVPAGCRVQGDHERGQEGDQVGCGQEGCAGRPEVDCEGREQGSGQEGTGREGGHQGPGATKAPARKAPAKTAAAKRAPAKKTR